MRSAVVLLLLVCSSLVADVAIGKEGSSGDGFAFYGDILAIDPHSITVKSAGKRLVFQINEETKITDRSSRPIQLDQIKPGDGATVLMKLGQGNVGIAVRIRVDRGWSLSSSLKLFVAKTIKGEVVSGMAINNYVAYQPADDGWLGGATFERAFNEGVFLLEVQLDGTVYQVKMVKSMGYEELNLRAIRWFRQWRFKPNTVTEVQMPMAYFQSKYY